MHIQYSERYSDDLCEYRHVILPPSIASQLPEGKLLSEAEWRGLGVQQSRGWEHYAIHRPEPHILLFRRPLPPRDVASKDKRKEQNRPTLVQTDDQHEDRQSGC